MSKIDHEAFDILGEMLRPPPPPKKIKDETWAPSLTPTQQRLFDSTSKYILCWSEKGTGKSVGCVEKMVRHCYENQNAFGLILVSVKSMATKGGAWDKLIDMILPDWGQGMGLDYSDVKHDEQHNQMVWIANQYGGWSKIIVISSPHYEQLRSRIRGYEPSMVFVDELTSCDSPEYFESVAAQLGRCQHVTGPQQFLAACNPEGPSHWVYKKWWVDAFDSDTGEWDPDFENIYFPFDDNKENMEGYQDSLKKIYRHNPLELARMVRGEWIDRPTGESLFGGLYNPTVHVRPRNPDGEIDQRYRLMPDKDHAMIIGLDPGSVYNSFIFQQWLNIEDKMCWVTFDEIVITKKRISYERLVPLVMERIRWWRNRVNSEMPQVWISDVSAFNQYRAASGSYDVLEIERIYEANRENIRFRLEPMKVKPAPSFNGSRVARVRTGQQLMAQDQIIISSGCPHVQKMFLQLEGKRPKPGEALDPEAAMTPVRSDVLHIWDAWSYPVLLASLNPTALTSLTGPTMRMAGRAA